MSFERPRKLTDPKAMRALAHPVRLALLEALADARPADRHRGRRAAWGRARRTRPSTCASSPSTASSRRPRAGRAAGGRGSSSTSGMRFTDVHDGPGDRRRRPRARAASGSTATSSARRARARGAPRAARGVARGHGLEPDAALPHAGRAQAARRGASSSSLLDRFGDRRTPSPDHARGRRAGRDPDVRVPRMRRCSPTATRGCSSPASRSACSATRRCGSRSGCGSRT